MREVSVGPATAFADPGRKVIEIGGLEVGVFRLGADFFAYLNVCPHMGGPVCQGKVLPRVEEHVADDKKSRGMAFSKTQTNIVCPWHGYEFDIRSGQHQGSVQFRLKPIDVRIADGEVFVLIPDRTRRAKTP